MYQILPFPVSDRPCRLASGSVFVALVEGEKGMAKVVKLGRDARGNYQRDIGQETKQSGKVGQHRFYFGADPHQSQIRCLHVLRCWDNVEARWNKRERNPARWGERPLWNKTTAALAVAVANGSDEYNLEPSQVFAYGGLEPREGTGFKGAEGHLLPWFRELQEDFPMIRLRQVGDWPHDSIDRQRRHAKEKAEELMRYADGPVQESGQTLHKALNAFSAWIADSGKYQAEDSDGLSQHGRAMQRQVRTIKEHAKDIPLEALDNDEITRWRSYWANRPATKAYANKGQPVSRETALNHLKRISAFLTWLHKSKLFMWRRPEDYELEHMRIKDTQKDKARRVSAKQVSTYTAEQLATLWKYASSRERLWLVLSLNCGFGQAELVSLETEEVLGDYIKRIRGKSGVYGEWKLWDVTGQALAWWKKRRPETDETAVIVSKHGKKLKTTKGGNRCGAIANAWVKLTRKIKVDKPDFPQLSFNKLRKTGGNLVRGKAGGEMMRIYHARKKTVTSDDEAERYSDRPFAKLFDVLDAIRADLSLVFDAVADPFPQDAKKRNPSISLGNRERIVALRKDGKQYAEIAAECEVSIDTVRRYLTEAGLTRKYQKKE